MAFTIKTKTKKELKGMDLTKFKTKEELRLAIEEGKKSLDIHNFDKSKIIKLSRMCKYYNNWETMKWLESIAKKDGGENE